MKNKIILIISILLLQIQLTNAQSDFLWAIHTDLGVQNSIQFTQNNLSKKFSSPTTGLSTSAIYRWKDLVSVELGAGQFFNNIRLQDKAFKTLNEGFSVKHSNKNSYWNYYGAIGFNIPLSDYTFIYTQFSYSMNHYGIGNKSTSENFIYNEKQKDQTIVSSTSYSKSNVSYIPEIGIQQKLDNGHILSFGIKMNLGQSEMMNGKYTVTDNYSAQTLHQEDYNTNGNFVSLNVKYAILLHQTSPSKKTKQNEVIVCHLGKNKKIPLSLLEIHLAHGDTKGGCSKQTKENEVTVCHLGKKKKIPASLLEIHLAHGDTKGECTKKQKENEVTVCHLGKKKKIPASLLETHLAHGDTKGECPKKGKEPKAEKVKEELKVDKDGIPKTLNDREIVKSKTIYVESETITFKVWDSGKEVDGDTVSLNLNGKWIIENFGLSRSKHDIIAKIDKNGKNFLMLYALNLGKYPPNTAAVSVWDGKEEQILELKSDLKSCGSLNIIYRPK